MEGKTILSPMFIELSKKYSFNLKTEESSIRIDYFYWFKIDYISYLVNKVEKNISKQLIEQYKDVTDIWRVIATGYQIVVFYNTEIQKKLNELNGISKNIINEYFSKIKEIDAYDFYTKDLIYFESKENLDKNYKGDLYIYFR